MDKVAHGGSFCGRDLDRDIGEFLVQGADCIGELGCGDNATFKRHGAVCGNFQQYLVAVALLSAQTFRARHFELQHAYLAFEFGLYDKKDEQNRQDIQHRYNIDATDNGSARVDVHGWCGRAVSKFVTVSQQVGKLLVELGCFSFCGALEAGLGYDARHGYG